MRLPLPIGRDKYLTGQELCGVYRTCYRLGDTPEWRDPVAVARAILGLGFRVSELVNLRLEDCESDMVHVRHSKTGRPRMVKPMPEFLPWYQDRLSWVSGPWYIGRAGDPEPYSKRTFQRWWNDLLRLSGVRVISIHGGRHTYATHELGSRRLQAHEVQAQLGHTDLDMTMAFYVGSATEYMSENRSVVPWRAEALKGAPEQEQGLRMIEGGKI